MSLAMMSGERDDDESVIKIILLKSRN